MLVVFAAVVLGGVALLLVAFGNELDRQLDREMSRVEREFERNLETIREDVREELDNRLPATPTPTP
jgi:hypothetical protein